MADYAITANGDIVTIECAAAMTDRSGLRCPGHLPDGDIPCPAHMHLCALNSVRSRPYFAALPSQPHGAGCNHASLRSRDDPTPDGHSTTRVDHSIVRLAFGPPEPTRGPDGRHRSGSTEPTTTTPPLRRRGGPSTKVGRVLRAPALLAAILDNPQRFVDRMIDTPTGRRPGADVIVPAECTTVAQHVGHWLVVWGKVKEVRPTPYHGWMIGFPESSGQNEADRPGILLTEGQAAQLAVKRDALAGRSVLAGGTWAIAKNGRSHLRLDSIDAIAFDPDIAVRPTHRTT